MAKQQFFTLCEVSQVQSHMTLLVEMPDDVTEEQVMKELEENPQEFWDAPGDGFDCGAKLVTSYESETHVEPLDYYHRRDCRGLE